MQGKRLRKRPMRSETRMTEKQKRIGKAAVKGAASAAFATSLKIIYENQMEARNA